MRSIQSFARLGLFLLVFTAIIAGVMSPCFAQAQQPTSLRPIPAIERRLPPAGIEVPAGELAELRDALEGLTARLDRFRASARGRGSGDLIADVDVFRKAVRFALMFNEFYQPNHTRRAAEAITEAHRRLDALESGRAPWAESRGRVVRGYVSEIDGSSQPYGLEIPEGLDLSGPVPLYVWLHGRGDRTTDLHFLAERAQRGSPITEHAADGIILHPYGRGTLGFKSAGEIDVLDAIESVKSRYNIDEDRVALMGFSMGGAGAWHIGAHYADRFAVVHAGAGFAETAEYNNLSPEDYPAWYEQVLWRVYDVPHYVRNFMNVPVIAYSGENDRQIQAARVMERAFEGEGMELRHVIGPGMGHEYHPESLEEVMEFVKGALAEGRDRNPREVHLQTRTLRYNKMHWVEVLEQIEPWVDTRIHAVQATGRDVPLTFETKNVRAFRIPYVGLVVQKGPKIDGQQLGPQMWRNIRAPDWLYFRLEENGEWKMEASPGAGVAQRKWAGLAGPIDDAFHGRFLVVVPTAREPDPIVEGWVRFEVNHLIDRWRALYRGEPRVKRDVDVTVADREENHLVLFGTPRSNRVMAELMRNEGGALRWDETGISVGGSRYSDTSRILMGVLRNDSGGYVVLNSGPTHRESHDRTNSLQNPKLPDYAVIDVTVAPDGERPGRVVDAGFFDADWGLAGPRPVADDFED